MFPSCLFHQAAELAFPLVPPPALSHLGLHILLSFFLITFCLFIIIYYYYYYHCYYYRNWELNPRPDLHRANALQDTRTPNLFETGIPFICPYWPGTCDHAATDIRDYRCAPNTSPLLHQQQQQQQQQNKNKNNRTLSSAQCLRRTPGVAIGQAEPPLQGTGRLARTVKPSPVYITAPHESGVASAVRSKGS